MQESGKELFGRMEVRTITLTRPPRYPRRLSLLDRIRAAWESFWNPGQR